MNRYVACSCCCRSASRLRMAACTDTSSAEVGSSADHHVGPGAEGAPRSRPAAFRAAGQLAGGAALGGGPPAGPRRSARPAGPAAPSPVSPASRVSGRVIRLRTVCRRFSAESGFWNTICSARRISRGRRRASGLSGLSSKVTTEPWSGAVQPEQDPGQRGLAAARLADQAECLAPEHSQVHNWPAPGRHRGKVFDSFLDRHDRAAGPVGGQRRRR